MAVTLGEFTERIANSGLLTRDELNAQLEANPGIFEARQLAFKLVQTSRLTNFQAKALYNDTKVRLIFGEYIVIDAIAAGGMGDVYKARHRHMDRVVALKLLPSHLADSR